MKKYFLLGVSFIFIHAILGYWAQGQETRGPKMVLRERAFHAKDVKEGDSIEHTFKVLNNGDQALRIIRVKPG